MAIVLFLIVHAIANAYRTILPDSALAPAMKILPVIIYVIAAIVLAVSSIDGIHGIVKREYPKIAKFVLKLLLVVIVVFCLRKYVISNVQVIREGIYWILNIGAVFIALVVVATVVVYAYMFRVNIVKYLLTGKSLHLIEDTPLFQDIPRYVYPLIINGRNLRGQFSSMVEHSLAVRRGGQSRKSDDIVEVPLNDDIFTRIRTYKDIGENINPFSDEVLPGDEEADVDEEVPWLAKKILKVQHKVFAPLFYNRMFILESIDLIKILKIKKRVSDCERKLAASISRVYLVVSSHTTDEDIEQYVGILQKNNALVGFVLVTDKDAWDNVKSTFRWDASVTPTIGVENTREGVLAAVRDIEIRKMRETFGMRNALHRLVELDYVRHQLDKVQDGDTQAKMNDIVQRYANTVDEESVKDYYERELQRNSVPDSIKRLKLTPASELVRAMSAAPGHVSRIYIQFNIMEMIVKTMTVIRLLSLGENHSDQAQFPFSITKDGSSMSNVVGYTDDVLYLSAFVEQYQGNQGAGASTIDRLLYTSLVAHTEEGRFAELDRIERFFPFTKNRPISNRLDLLKYSIDLRNNIRAHGVVTNFIAAVTWETMMRTLQELCSMINELDVGFVAGRDEEVTVRIGDKCYPGGKYLIYRTDPAEFYYLEGIRKGKLCYIGYSTGTKYRPSVIVLENAS